MENSCGAVPSFSDYTVWQLSRRFQTLDHILFTLWLLCMDESKMFFCATCLDGKVNCILLTYFCKHFSVQESKTLFLSLVSHTLQKKYQANNIYHKVWLWLQTTCFWPWQIWTSCADLSKLQIVVPRHTAVFLQFIFIFLHCLKSS